MVLSGVVPEIFYFNFLGAWFTHSPWFSLGVTALLWFMNTVIAVHRNDKFGESSLADSSAAMIANAFEQVLNSAPALADVGAQSVSGSRTQFDTSFVADSAADLIITLNFRTPVSGILGTLLGLTVVWAFQLPPLLDPYLWHVRKRLSMLFNRQMMRPNTAQQQEFFDDQRDNATDRLPVWVVDASVPRFIAGGVLAGAAGNFLLGNFEPEVPPNSSLAIGIAGMVFGLWLAIYTLIRWYRSESPSDHLNFGYSIALVAYMVLPAIYDFLLNIRPHQGYLFQAGLALVSIVTVFASIRFFRRLSFMEVQWLEDDVRYSSYEASSSRQWTRWLSLWIPLAIIYLVAWIRDEQTQREVEGEDKTIGDVTQVLLAVAAAWVVLEIVFLIWGYFRWRKPRNASRWISNESVLDSFVIVPTDSLVGFDSRNTFTNSFAKAGAGKQHQNNGNTNGSSTNEATSLHARQRSVRSQAAGNANQWNPDDHVHLNAFVLKK